MGILARLRLGEEPMHIARRRGVQQAAFQIRVGQGLRQRCQQAQIEVWGVGGHGDKTNQLQGTAVVAGREIYRLGHGGQSQTESAGGATARVWQGDVAAENGALQVFALEHRLQKAEAVGDDVAPVQRVHQFVDSADFGVGCEPGNQQIFVQ